MTSQILLPEMFVRKEEFFISDLKSKEDKLVDLLHLPIVNRSLISPYHESSDYFIYPIETAYIITNPISYLIIANGASPNICNNQVFLNKVSTNSIDEQITVGSRYFNILLCKNCLYINNH